MFHHCHVKTWPDFVQDFLLHLDPRLRKCIKQRTAWALPRNLCQTARVKRVSCCWKRPSPRRLYSAWSTDSCDSWEQVNNSMMQILIISHFFCFRCCWVFWRFRTVWSQETDLKQNDSGPKMSLEAEIRDTRRIRIVLFLVMYLNPNI